MIGDKSTREILFKVLRHDRYRDRASLVHDSVEKILNSKTLFLAGYARLPQGMAAKTVFESMTITVEIEPKYGVILSADCTLITELGRNFIGTLLRGYSLNDGIDVIIEAIEDSYRGKATSALIAALRDLEHQYQHVKRK